MGLSQGIASLGRIVGSLFAGSILALVGPGAPFVVSSTLTFLMLLLAFSALPIALKRSKIDNKAFDDVAFDAMQAEPLAGELKHSRSSH